MKKRVQYIVGPAVLLTVFAGVVALVGRQKPENQVPQSAYTNDSLTPGDRTNSPSNDFAGASAVAVDNTASMLHRTIKIASWNIAWLHNEDEMGKVAKQNRDYLRLAGDAQELDADIVALQKVRGSAAASRVFDPELYNFYFPDNGQAQQAGFAYKKDRKRSGVWEHGAVS